MRDPALDRPTSRDQRLGGDQPTEDAGSPVMRAEPAIQIDVELLQVEPLEQTAQR